MTNVKNAFCVAFNLSLCVVASPVLLPLLVVVRAKKKARRTKK